jgi:hypothetical protein
LRLGVLLSTVFFFVTVSSAFASGKVLSSSAVYNPIAADISALPDMNAQFEDDWNEWALLAQTNCTEPSRV